MNFSSIFVAFVTMSCVIPQTHGTLRVNHGRSGFFEVYRLASETPLQFVSELRGEFNADIALQPGSYLVLADCSSELVSVFPGEKKVLVAHQVNFLPMMAPMEQDHFSVQCFREEKTHLRQVFTNKFSLAVLGGSRDILVGMVPMTFRFPADEGKPNLVTVPLASLMIERPGDGAGDFVYFVSPVDQKMPYTEPQRAGSRQFLPAGGYRVELNGTEMFVDLSQGQQTKIVPALLRLETSPKVDVNRATVIRGSPLHYEINGSHWLTLNTTYPVVPGVIDIRLDSNFKSERFTVVSGEMKKIALHSVEVNLNCEDNDWRCLGQKKVRLYEPGEPSPFAEGLTDVPLLYFAHDPQVGIEGAREIRLQLAKLDHQKIAAGFLKVEPNPSFRPGALTDLLRVESRGAPFKGHSLDIMLDKLTTMPLFVGHYHLANYVTFSNAEGSRRKSSMSFEITAGETTTLEVPTFLSEKKFATMRQKESQEMLE